MTSPCSSPCQIFYRDVIYRTFSGNTAFQMNWHVFSFSSLYPFLSLLIFIMTSSFFCSFVLSYTPRFAHLLVSSAALSGVEGTNCICRSPCNMTRYNKELSMVKIPSKTSARYLEKKFNRSEKYITWVLPRHIKSTFNPPSFQKYLRFLRDSPNFLIVVLVIPFAGFILQSYTPHYSHQFAKLPVNVPPHIQDQRYWRGLVNDHKPAQEQPVLLAATSRV